MTRMISASIPGLLLIAFFGLTASAQTKPDKDYLVYVVSESADKIALVRFASYLPGAVVDPFETFGPSLTIHNPLLTSLK